MSEELKIETLPLDQLKPDPQNARGHDERNISSIMFSLKRFGQRKPIVADVKGVIAAGNGTYEAAKRLGWKTIQVVRTELTGAELDAYKIADNRTTDLSSWDYPTLVDVLRSIKDEDAGLVEAAGFIDNEADALLAAQWQPPPVESVEVEPSKPKGGGQSHSLHFTDDQWPIVVAAIEKLRQSENDPAISGPRACELICADWLAGQ